MYRKERFISLLKDILFKAKKIGFPAKAGICSFFFLFWHLNKISMNEMQIYSEALKKHRPRIGFFEDMIFEKSYRSIGSDYWWFLSDDGYKQRIIFLEKLINYLEDDSNPEI